jgi:putative phosphoesterase
MKLAVLSDIHGNFTALCTAVRDAENRGAERFIAAGDLVGRGPHPVEVMRFLREKRIPAIRGNMEKKLLLYREGKRDMKAGLKKKSHFAWSALQCGKGDWRYLENLPSELSLRIEGFDVLVVHGSTVSDTDAIYPSITSRGLTNKLGDRKPDLLLCGHTHIPFCKRVGGVHVVNSGAVGISVDGDPRGSYALLDLKEGSPSRCRILRFSYPYGNVTLDLKKKKVPGVDSATFEKGM